MTQSLEPSDSRTKILACSELNWKLQERIKDRVIGYVYSSYADQTQKTVQRIHRTFTTYD